ncbi:Degenerin deg-1, partial [Trichostrongylus colubriformis]
KTKCICTYDHHVKDLHPCFNVTLWSDQICSSCEADGLCNSTTKRSFQWPCSCRNRTESESVVNTPYCIVREQPEIRKLWLSYLDRPFSLPVTTLPIPVTTQQSTKISSIVSSASTAKATTAQPKYRKIVTDPETIEAMGFSGMTDGVAMVTKAKENLIFTMSSLPYEQRVALSQTKEEFIEMCSFNGHQCNISK